MFLSKIDWTNPRFSRWNLSRLEPMNEAQRDAFLEFNVSEYLESYVYSIDKENITCTQLIMTHGIFVFQKSDFPAFTESELREIALTYPCRVELFHSNVCHGVEKSWPKLLFKKDTYSELLPHQKRTIQREMERQAVDLYKTYVDENRLKRRRKRQTNRALAAYYDERYLFNLFTRIRRLGDEHIYGTMIMTDSNSSWTTVINTQETPQSTNRRTPIGSELSFIHSDSDTRTESIIYHERSDVSESGKEELKTPTKKQSKRFGKRRTRNKTILSSAANGDEFPNQNNMVSTTLNTSPNKLETIATPTNRSMRQLRSRLVEIESVSQSNIDDRNVTKKRPRINPMRLRSDAHIANATPKTSRRKTAEKSRRKSAGNINTNIMRLRSGTTISPKSKTHRPFLLPKQELNSIDMNISTNFVEISNSAFNTPTVNQRNRNRYSKRMRVDSVRQMSLRDEDDVFTPYSYPTPSLSTSDFVLIDSHLVKFRHDFEDNLEFFLNPMFRNT